MTNEEITRALAEPFEPSEVKFKPAVVSGNRAMALAYVDARVIQDRLDEVLGVDGWTDEYSELKSGSMLCKLSIRMEGGVWVYKMDVGERGDQGDPDKGAVSDALKRAAVKFGIGRYLYRLPAQWADYDPQRRQFTKKPQLPAAVLPQRDKDHSRREAEADGLHLLKAAALKGMADLERTWKSMTAEQRKACMGRLPDLKADAALIDQERSGNAPASA